MWVIVGSESLASPGKSPGNRNNNRGGYNTDVHVLDTERKFDRIQFTPGRFTMWYNMFINVRTYDTIAALKTNGYVADDGRLTEMASESMLPLTPGQFIDDNRIRSYYRSKYPTSWIYDELVRIGVLNTMGYLVGTDNFSENYKSTDFDVFIPEIDRIDFEVSNPVIAKSLATELLRFIMAESQVLIVTQEETTRYQSNRTNFFDNALDQLGGSIVGRVLFNDGIQTVKQKVPYSPNTSIHSLFGTIYFGFPPAPYAFGSHRNVVFYGKDKQRFGELSLANGRDDTTVIGIDAQFMFAKSSSWSQAIRYQGPGIGGRQWTINDTPFTWINARYLWGTNAASLDQTLSLGATYYTTPLADDGNLGFLAGVSGTWHISRFIGLYYGAESSFGIRFSGDLPWQINTYGIGIETTLSPVQFGLGYQWLDLLVWGNKMATLEGIRSHVRFYF
jgi:hypothetical protein